jgi:hypothetical protein
MNTVFDIVHSSGLTARRLPWARLECKAGRTQRSRRSAQGERWVRIGNATLVRINVCDTVVDDTRVDSSRVVMLAAGAKAALLAIEHALSVRGAV